MTSPKAKKQSFGLLRGMKDVLPEEERYWIFMSDRVRDFALRFGFRRIETSILEQAGLYLRTSGLTSDVVTNDAFKALILDTIKEVEDGNSITTSFAKSKLVPTILPSPAL